VQAAGTGVPAAMAPVTPRAGTAGAPLMTAAEGAGTPATVNTPVAGGVANTAPVAGVSAVAAGGGGMSAAAGRGASAGSAALATPQSYPALKAADFGAPKVISTAFSLAEGPVWDHCGNQLLFVDVNSAQIHMFTLGGQVGVYMEMTNYSNGLVFEPDGNLLMAEMGNGKGGRISRLHRDKTVEVLIDHDPMGAKLNTTDDLALRSDGTIYFTDPIISHGTYVNDLASVSVQAFYQLKPGTGTREVVKMGMATLPNGIKFSPDEKILYLDGMFDNTVFKYTVAPDGSLTAAGSLVTNINRPDSLCVDAAGNLYVGTTEGLRIVRPDGSNVTTIPIQSSKGTTNCGFGGPDGKTLFITAWTTLAEVDNVPIPGNEWVKNQQIPCQ
jgi:gluconolactonase